MSVREVQISKIRSTSEEANEVKSAEATSATPEHPDLNSPTQHLQLKRGRPREPSGTKIQLQLLREVERPQSINLPPWGPLEIERNLQRAEQLRPSETSWHCTHGCRSSTVCNALLGLQPVCRCFPDAPEVLLFINPSRGTVLPLAFWCCAWTVSNGEGRRS